MLGNRSLLILEAASFAMEKYRSHVNFILANVENYQECLGHLNVFEVQSCDDAKLAGDAGGIKAIALIAKKSLADLRIGNHSRATVSIHETTISCLNNLAYFNQNIRYLADQEAISALCEALIYSYEVSSEQLPLVLNAVFNCTFTSDPKDYINPDPIPTLQKILEKGDETCKASATLVLANLIGRNDDDGLKMFEMTESTMGELVRAFESSFGRDYKGIAYGTATLLFTFLNLARNDKNKMMIATSKAMSKILQLLDPTFDHSILNVSPDHMNALELATAVIWQLSFDAEVRKLLVPIGAVSKLRSTVEINPETGPVDLIKKLRYIVSNELGTETAVKNAQGALWLLEGTESLSLSKKEPMMSSDSGNAKAVTSGNELSPNSYVMISYQWGHQDKILRLREILRSYGIPVWIDVERMQGSTLEAMADAVENAAAIIMGVSSKYKQSANCRLEAEFTVQQNKKIVPIMLESGYRATGWLGLVLGSKLWYSYTGQDMEDSVLQSFLSEVRHSLPSTASGGSVKGLVSSSSNSIHPSVATAAVSHKNIATLDVEGVCNFLMEEGISTAIINAFATAKIDGKCLTVLRQWSSTRPDFFINFLRNELFFHGEVSELLHLSFALINSPK